MMELLPEESFCQPLQGQQPTNKPLHFSFGSPHTNNSNKDRGEHVEQQFISTVLYRLDSHCLWGILHGHVAAVSRGKFQLHIDFVLFDKTVNGKIGNPANHPS